MATDLREAIEVSASSLPDFADFVDFAVAGSNASGEFRCADCGYGAVVQRVVPPCPMCRGTIWEQREPGLAR